MKMLIPSISSAIALFALTATAAEYTVTSNADSGEGTLRALCATVAMGDTIFIPGDIGPIALASEINLAPAQKVLRFVGIGEGENRPVITGVGSHRTFVIGRQIMAGVGTKHEFRNLIFRNITSNADGAAIYLNDYAPTGVTISNCLFEACSAPAGGAIRLNRIDQWYEIQDCVFKDCVSADGYALCGGKVKVERCWFEGNQSTKNASCFGAQAGGANIFTDCVFTNNVGINGGCVSVAQTPTNFFTRCVFVDNEATGTGGVFYSRNPLTLNDCTFLRNHAFDGGGAIFRYNQNLKIYNCVFEKNSAAGGSNWQGGAVIFNRDDSNTECIISNCVFRENYNLEGSGLTGVIHGYGSNGSISIADTLFERNQALGGAGVMKITHRATLENCVFKENFCSNGVGALWITTSDVSHAYPTTTARPILLENCTFYGNRTLTGRGMISVSNTGSSTVYTDANGDVIPVLNTYLAEHPGEAVTTNKVDNVDHVTVRHCTMVSNTIPENWGMINIGNPARGSRVTLDATVFYGNTSNGRPYDIQGKLQSVNYTAFESAESSISMVEPENSANNWFAGALGDPQFAEEMAANESQKVFLDGSVLPTLAFSLSSPLRDRVPRALALETDARGMPRGAVSGLADIGAWEFQLFVPTVIMVR